MRRWERNLRHEAHPQEAFDLCGEKGCSDPWSGNDMVQNETLDMRPRKAS